MSKNKDDRKDAVRDMGLGLGGILKGLGDLVEKLGEIAENGEQISKTGGIGGDGKGFQGVYGFTVKTGLGNDKTRVEPFGNIRKDKVSGQTVVQEIREPVVDVFVEDQYVIVVAEMPGISAEDVHIERVHDVVTLVAEHGPKKYSKEILLPESVSDAPPRVSCHNGVLEIKFAK
jgi:HSP20 family protein